MTTGITERGPENYISLKLCPVCGEAPEKTTYDLGRPGGHGYPGHKSYQYKCECCKLVRGKECDDIYCSNEEAQQKAKLSWNEEVYRIQNYLRKQRGSSRSPIENDII